MRVGVPKEIKSDEYRVAMMPVGVELLTKAGHEVMVEANAGVGSGFADEDYQRAGARIVEDAKEIFDQAEMLVKVKEPMPSEIGLFKPGQIVFTYFHFAASQELTQGCLESEIVAIAYETIKDRKGSLPLLTPMSEIAGKLSCQEGAKFLERPMMGRGNFRGIGTDHAVERLRYLDDVMPANVHTIFSDPATIREQLALADLVVGAVLIPGAKAPRLVKRSDLAIMKNGSVIVDVAIDQGGCVETARATTHQHPTYIVDGVVHYCVANMPGAVGRTSTIALCNATLPYALKIASKGYERAAAEDPGFAEGINMAGGRITNAAVAESMHMKYEPLKGRVTVTV